MVAGVVVRRSKQPPRIEVPQFYLHSNTGGSCPSGQQTFDGSVARARLVMVSWSSRPASLGAACLEVDAYLLLPPFPYTYFTRMVGASDGRQTQAIRMLRNQRCTQRQWESGEKRGKVD